jgi:hypothetical protein
MSGDRLARVEGEATAIGIMPQSFNDVARMAKALSEARGFVPREMIGNPNAIAAAIMTGLEIGIGPMQALRSVYVINGRPLISADLMLSLAIRAGVRPQWIEQTAEVARLRLTRPGFEPHEHAFTIEEAKRAKLSGDNWQKYPAAMLRARCLSAAMRAYCPDVIGSGVYVEGEIEPVAAVDREPAPVVRSAPQSIEDAIIEAEASCAAEPPVEQPKRKGSKPEDCDSREALEAWLAQHGVEVLRRGESAIKRVVAQATRLELVSDDEHGEVSSYAWVTKRLAKMVQGTEAA